MELHEDEPYFKPPILLDEHIDYIDTQVPYYDALHRLADQEAITRSAKIPADGHRSVAPACNMSSSTNFLQRTGFRDMWRYDDALEAHQPNFESDFHPSPAQCLNQELVCDAQPLFEELHRMGDTSDAEAYKDGTISSSASPKIDSSPIMELWPFTPDESSPAFRSEMSVLTTDNQDDEDASGDKPYARLIHEALMQAPGHRMMLREIYDWFVQNTTKPSESGTNGWQNSIRHNLSMNQVSDCKELCW